MNGRVLLHARIGGEVISFPVTIHELREGRSYWRKVLVEFAPEKGGTGRLMEVAVGDLMSDEATGDRHTGTSIQRTLRAEKKGRRAKIAEKKSRKR